jgi:hypothetical protein
MMRPYGSSRRITSWSPIPASTTPGSVGSQLWMRQDDNNTAPPSAGGTVHVIYAGARPLSVAHAALPPCAKAPAGASSPATESL